jgi:glyoxylase-like metal-dependent hydrolase (beta-lactamase superfamily II)
MKKEFFAFEVGEFNCISVYDGYHDYRIESLFPGIDRGKFEKILPGYDLKTNLIRTPYTSLYIDTGEHRVLIDAGAGSYFPTTGRLSANLQKAGVQPSEINALVITHAHPDHIGGVLSEDGKPTYPNARVYTTKIEWDFWLAEDALEKVPGFKSTIELAHKVFDAMEDRFIFIQPDCEIVPGIWVLAAYGHTPGHLAVEVLSMDKSVIYISDAILHPLNIDKPDWLPDPRYIFDTDQFKDTACRLLNRALVKNALVLGMHFWPFPSLGYIIRSDEGLKWQPWDHSRSSFSA